MRTEYRLDCVRMNSVRRSSPPKTIWSGRSGTWIVSIELARGVVDEDLAGGEPDVAVAVLGQALPALLGERPKLGQGSVGIHLAAIGPLLGFVGDVETDVRRISLHQAVRLQRVGPLVAEVRRPRDEDFVSGMKTLRSGETYW